MNNEIICPDVEKLGPRYKGKLNFPLDRCIERFRSKAVGCRRCPTGLSWTTKKLIWWPMWEKERRKNNVQISK